VNPSEPQNLPMLEITILASGSNGNAALVRTETVSFLVDAGLSTKELTLRLASCGVEPRDLKAVLITHEHGDHSRGLAQWAKRHATPIYCNRQTAAILRDKVVDFSGWKIFETGAEFVLEGTTIRSFLVPHDAVEPVGFVIRSRGRSFGFLTDLGHATTLVTESLRGVEGLLIETNYDEELLQQDTKRPWAIKQRIQSRHGHLSNAAAAETVAQIHHDGLAHLLLGHLSRDCNREDLALAAMKKALDGSSTEIFCATQETISPSIRLA
jgi:phosphoribosyl 1,2-cyclic phosphodiesterase